MGRGHEGIVLLERAGCAFRNLGRLGEVPRRLFKGAGLKALEAPVHQRLEIGVRRLGEPWPRQADEQKAEQDKAPRRGSGGQSLHDPTFLMLV